MDPERIRAYLQVACAGLGFDIGEVWWTSNENGSSTVAAIEEHVVDDHPHDALVDRNDTNGGTNKLRFVQLYTSKSFESRRDELVNPPSEEASYTISNGTTVRRSSSTENLQKHVLSPSLVEAISRTTQVVWANTKKREGLTGRSDIRLQTAVGMPVAMDASGNMCIVVMFSPNNIQSSDEAMEYLQSLSRSATSSAIPCLLPVTTTTTNGESSGMLLPLDHPSVAAANSSTGSTSSSTLVSSGQSLQSAIAALGEGVTARFVSFDDISSSTIESHSHELSQAPKDTFGIPMLPVFAELGSGTTSSGGGASGGGGGYSNNNMTSGYSSVNYDYSYMNGTAAAANYNSFDGTVIGSVTPEGEGETIDAFDEASYGIWNTIMDDMFHQDPAYSSGNDMANAGNSGNSGPAASQDSSLQEVYLPNQQLITEARKERLEEFLSAFLAMSVFDVADVWVPAACDGYPDCLRHVVSVDASTGSCSSSSSHAPSSFKTDRLFQFEVVSEHALIKFWTGAVGRAYSSGNPVWSCNPGVFVDAGRAQAFELAGIQTVLAVPVFSQKQALPTCVVSCYSLVKSTSVPFVLRFVQQALRLLWEGLDQFEPQNQTLATNYWSMVHPADLGEMAADVEMQQHFLSKKRPYNLMDNTTAPSTYTGEEPMRRTSFIDFAAAAAQVDLPEDDDDYDRREIDSDEGSEDSHSNLLASQLQSIRLPNGDVICVPLQLTDNDRVPIQQQQQQPPPPPQLVKAEIPFEAVQEHLAQAVRSVQDAVPFSDHHSSTQGHRTISTNVEGTKRAHVLTSSTSATPRTNISPSVLGPIGTGSGFAFMPLPMPRPFPSHVVRVSQSSLNVSNHSAVSLPNIGGSSNHSAVSLPSPHVVNNSSINSSHHSAVSLPPLSNMNISSSHRQQIRQQHQPLPHPGQPLHQQSQPLPSSMNSLPAASPAASSPLHVVESQNRSNLQHYQFQPIEQQQQRQEQQQPVLMDRSSYSMPLHQQQPLHQQVMANTPHPPQPQMSSLDHHAFNIPVLTTSIRNESKLSSPAVPGMDNTNLFCQPTLVSDVGGSTSNLVGLVNAGSNGCRIIGCDMPALSRRPYCEVHSGNRLCEHDGCSKCAQGCTRFCIAHGGGRRCTFPGCDKGARDKFYCAAHGGGKRCRHDGCNKSAVGGSDLCTAHGGGRRCEVDGCDKSAQSSTRFCVKHGGGKKCAHEGCDKVARGRTNYCAAHGGGVRCKLEGCNRVAIGKMQLCRAHGGSSSRARKKGGSVGNDGDSTPSPTFDDEDPQYSSPSPSMLHNTQQQEAMFAAAAAGAAVTVASPMDFHMAVV